MRKGISSMKTTTLNGFMLILFTICFLGLPGCVPTSENIDLIAPEEVVTVVASRIPTVKPTSPVIATPTPLASPRPRFIYVIEVTPPENSVMTVGEYNSQRVYLYENQLVCVEVYVESVIQPRVELSYETIMDHINLQVDGIDRSFIGLIKVAEATQNESETEGVPTYFYDGIPSTICWQADLTEGIHEATFQVRQMDGNVLSYSWRFELTGDD